MQAIILAGGFGTRLKSMVSDVPKPMAPINDRPFLEYLLDDLDKAGFDKVILTVGYKKEVIMEYFGNRYKNLFLVYSIENEPLGTGGCIVQALKYIDDEYFFVLNGDTMFKIDFCKMAKTKTLSIACKKMFDFDRYGEVSIDKESTIISFEEKKKVLEGYINGGIYYLPKNIFSFFQLPKKFSIENDFFTKYCKQLRMKAYLSSDYFIDIGVPDDYKKAQSDFARKKALFLDRDGIVNIDYGHVHQIKDFKFTNFIFKLCMKYQNLGYWLIIVTNQAGIGKKIYSEEEYEILTEYMLKQFEKKGVHILKVYYCPHLPKEDCQCRKPKPGLFLKAIADFDLVASECIAIGDKLSDLEAAYNAGITKLMLKKSEYEEYEVPFKYQYFEEADLR